VLGALKRGDDEIALDGQWDTSGSQVLLAFRSGAAWLIDPTTFERVQEAFEHEGPIVSAAFSPDSRRVATASQDGTARLWDVGMKARSKPATLLPGKANPILVTSGEKSLITVLTKNEVFIYLPTPMI
jgi:WD40 repeat protein